MAIPDMSGVSLLTAIRQISDPVAWAEFELLLGLEGGDVEARAGWNADDWARYDFQLVLKLEVAPKKPTEYIHALHRWARLRLAFKKRLQSGELVATGYVKPVKLASERTAIPADKWRFLKLDFRNSAASGEGLEIVSILVCRADQADQAPSGRQSAEAESFAPGLYSSAALDKWYRCHVAEQQKAGKKPSRKDDWEAARRTLGDGVPRDAVREVRRRLAPDEWKRQGRRKADQETGEE